MNEAEGRDVLGRDIERFIALRIWQDHNMPIYGSFIGLDLVIFLAKSKYLSSPYSLKDVFHSLGYSEGALRIFIRRLEKDGWIRLDIWQGDRRNKKIIVSDRLFERVAQLFDYLSGRADVQLDIAKLANLSENSKLPSKVRPEDER